MQVDPTFPPQHHYLTLRALLQISVSPENLPNLSQKERIKRRGKKADTLWIHKYIALYPLMPLISEVQGHKAWVSVQGF